jgi:16S rRNA (cytosine1402-N4)-methyltransferase
MQNIYAGHYSVLLNETVAMLKLPAAETLFIDCTLGEGGHALKMLQSYPHMKLIGIDADGVMLERAKERLAAYHDRASFFNAWFDEFLANYPPQLPQPQAVLMDLGVSMFHFAKAGRGFSFHDTDRLDMRLNAGDTATAEELVNTLEENELADLLWRYGEERRSRAIAAAIVRARRKAPITDAKTLADIINSAVRPEKKPFINGATKTFQALRIAVNRELERLENALKTAFNLLAPDGRLAVISFHSLEDRIVKHFFADMARPCRCRPDVLTCRCSGPLGHLVNKGGTTAGTDELKNNKASRSARLRVIAKL